MGQFRVTFGFSGNNTGWSETHAYSNNQASLPSQVMPSAIAVAQLRVLMLGYPFQINAIRVSPYPKARAFLKKGPWSNMDFTATSGASEPAVVALQALAYASNGAPDQFKNNVTQHFLGAPPVQCLLFAGGGPGAGKVNGAVYNLANNFQMWKQAMVQNGFGWFAVTPIGVLTDITAVASKPSGQVVFTAAVAGLMDATYYNIRVRGMNSGKSPLNGQFIALWDATTMTFTTKEQVAFGPGQKPGQLQTYTRANTFVPYGDFVLGDYTIEHKRGKPFLSPRGRAPRRIRW